MAALVRSLVVILLALSFSSFTPTVKAASCTINSYDEVSSVVASCTDITVGSFTVPAGESLIMNMQDGTYLTFTGLIKFEHSNWNGPLVQLRVTNGVIKGDSNHLFHGQGESYWGNTGTKPLFMYINVVHTGVYGFKIKNCPERCVGIDGSRNSVFGNFIIDNADGVNLARNTDGFDVAKSSGITLKDTTVTNQDDCVAINSGSDILVDNFVCTGSHGFDIAAGQDLNNDNFVTNVTFQNSILVDSMVGLSMLSVVDGGTGEISKITYNNIKIQGASDYGIMFHQDFSNSGQGSTGKPVGTVVFSDITLNDIVGYVNGQYSAGVVLRCAEGYCKNFNFNYVDITGGKSPDECSIQPNGYTCH
ncbi:uncharacterized protein LOC132696850 [Cylas formicarius]|uniref:uncharacterized protein LOC132696850 n=1 Tax=Cylas formicarius TaxID=197179 RepID=UPI002958CF3C|nr:uncharacterized protein LOC132696850 [Cylas formicarius]